MAFEVNRLPNEPNIVETAYKALAKIEKRKLRTYGWFVEAAVAFGDGVASAPSSSDYLFVVALQ